MMTRAWQTKDGTGAFDALVSVLAAGDVMGCTADEIAATLGLPIDGAALQHDLEALVDQGILNRYGIGRGALYTLVIPANDLRVQQAGPAGLALKEPSARKAG